MYKNLIEIGSLELNKRKKYKKGFIIFSNMIKLNRNPK